MGQSDSGVESNHTCVKISKKFKFPEQESILKWIDS